jgi:ADP-ribosylglycohydrolase
MSESIEATILYDKTLGCLLGGLIGDAIGTPTEGRSYEEIERKFGWVDDFTSDGTDDTVMKSLLAQALITTDGNASLDDWAAAWLENWDAIFGTKISKFFISVLHTAHKLKYHSVPRSAALGNMPSSSSAMCISPVGIVNACNPRQAALQAYNLAGLIHVQDVGFCQDGAASMAAAVAAGFEPDATPQSMLDAALGAIHRLSGHEMLERISRALELARETGGYRRFREVVYQQADAFFCPLFCDSRETVPLSFALFLLGDGNIEQCVTYGANFGRDADTIASMCGALAGALQGSKGVKASWVEKVNQYASQDQRALARALAETASKKHEREVAAHERFVRIVAQ